MEAENLEQKKIGQRIKSVRVLTGLNQEEFARHEGFNHTSLRNWEFGRVSPRLEAIYKLIESFKKFNIFISSEWILRGVGEGPTFNNGVLSQFLPEDNNALIRAFKKSIDELGGKSVVVTVDNQDMAPFFNIGDLLGASIISLYEVRDWPIEKMKTLFADPVLVKATDENFQPRWVNFDGNTWWCRKQVDLSLERLSANTIGIIKMRIYA